MAHQPAHWPDKPDQHEDPPVGVTIRPLQQLPDRRQLPAPTIPAFGAVAGDQSRGSFGTPGGSAMAYYQRARAGEWTRFVRTLPLRLAAVMAAGGLAGTLAHGAGPRLAGPAAALAAGVLAGGSASACPRRRPRGGAAPAGSDAPPDGCDRWCGRAGRSCTTWPSPKAAPTATTC